MKRERLARTGRSFGSWMVEDDVGEPSRGASRNTGTGRAEQFDDGFDELLTLTGGRHGRARVCSSLQRACGGWN